MSGDVKKRAKGRPSTTTKRPLTVKRNNRLRNFHKSLVRPASVYERVTRDTETVNPHVSKARTSFENKPPRVACK